MAIKQINPYLNYDGTARKAIQLYEHALGATTEFIQTFGEAPNLPVPAEHKDRVIHARLRIGGGLIMISDAPPGQPPKAGNNTHVILDFDDAADLAKKFQALASDGKVIMAPHDTFWGAKFGMLVDAFGISWMFNCDLKKA